MLYKRHMSVRAGRVDTQKPLPQWDGALPAIEAARPPSASAAAAPGRPRCRHINTLSHTICYLTNKRNNLLVWLALFTSQLKLFKTRYLYRALQNKNLVNILF